MANDQPVDLDLAMTLLKKAINDHLKGKAGVAEQLGYGRTLIARVMSPNDPLIMSAKLAQAVIRRYYVVENCPATHQRQPIIECRRLALGKAPTQNPQSMRVWKCCQTCPHKPKPVTIGVAK
ncbi:MAG: hypothetical protein JNL84_00590 [Candidatus Accumulibacter sp.]|nr:hypothetical protein [Accumulibacter sp.]